MKFSTTVIRFLQGLLSLLAVGAATPQGVELLGDYQPAVIVGLGALVVLLQKGGAAFAALVEEEFVEVLERGPAWIGGTFVRVVNDIERTLEIDIDDDVVFTARDIIVAGAAALGYFYNDKVGVGEVNGTPEQVVQAGAAQLGLVAEVNDDGDLIKVSKPV